MNVRLFVFFGFGNIFGFGYQILQSFDLLSEVQKVLLFQFTIFVKLAYLC